MLSRVVSLLLILIVAILIIGFVTKLVRWAIGLAIIVGIAALVLQFLKKKA